MNRIFLITCFLISQGCHSGSIQKKEAEKIQAMPVVPEEEAFVEFDHRKEYLESYHQPENWDTSFSDNGRNYRLLFQHFCTWDSSITVPAKYNFDTNEDFVTHSFASQLHLLSGGDTLFGKRIEKQLFDSLLEPSWIHHAIIHGPVLDQLRDTITIRYSIGIPVTDLGRSVSIQIDRQGNHWIKP